MDKLCKLVVATRNPKKLGEMRRLLESLEVEATSLDAFEGIVEAEETGGSFEENAAIKALVYAAQTSMPCVADDSGLEVEALAGAPGVFSSRYAGPGADGEALCRKLLSEMEDVPDGERRARFRCCIALAIDGKVVLRSEGSAQGRIIREMRGGYGFGYDPVFVPEGCDLTFAEMRPEQKDKLSHRAKALASFKKKLLKLFEQPGGGLWRQGT